MALTEAQAAALVDQLEDDAAILHDIVHGGTASETETEGGIVPSIAKVIDDAEVLLDMMLDEAEGDLGAAVAKAEAWAEEAEDVEVEAGKYSAKHHATKAAAIAASLVNVLEFKGGWDASTAAYPAAPEVGDLYTITVAGTIAAVDWRVGDEMVYADTGWVQVGRDLTASEIVSLLVGEFTDAAHGELSGGVLHDEATTETAGFMSAGDKVDLEALKTAVPGGGATGQVLGYGGTWVTTRMVLAGATSYHVNAGTGSDLNDGSMGAPFATIPKAMSVLGSIDFNNQNVAVELADGNYAGAIVPPVTIGQASESAFTIKGNAGAPANVVLTHTSSLVTSLFGTRMRLQDVKVEAPTAGHCIVSFGGIIQFGNLVFGVAAGEHIYSVRGGNILALSNYSIVGGAMRHWRAGDGGQVICQGRTITLTGAPAFSTFAFANISGVMNVNGDTFSGAATGTRYSAQSNAVINTAGGGASYLPGDVAGSTVTGGQYL